MLDQQIIKGARVRCVFTGSTRCGELATIAYVSRGFGITERVIYYKVLWDDNEDHSTQWERPTSFELIEPAPTTSTSKREPSIYERTRHAMKFL